MFTREIRHGVTAAVLAVAVLAAVPARAPAQGVKPQPQDTEWNAPPTEKAKTPPQPASPEGIERGHRLYLKHCATCHGDKGRGDGPLARLHAQRTSRPPYDLTLPEVQTFLTDGEIFWKITVGYRRADKVIMPSYKTQVPADEDRWRIVQFVRTLGPGK
jgi:mono/diheme cytochrome c family protein